MQQLPQCVFEVLLKPHATGGVQYWGKEVRFGKFVEPPECFWPPYA